MVNDYQLATNIFSLALKLYWGQRLKFKIQALCSEIKSMAKRPLCSLKWQNSIPIWYFNENEVIWNLRGHIVLKHPRNYKFKFEWARAKSDLSHLNRFVHFISSCSFKKCTDSQRLQNSRSIAVLHTPTVSETKPWQYFENSLN